MELTGIKSIDHAPNTLNEWLNTLSRDLGLEDRHRAYMLFRTTLHAVRDWLSVDEAAQLAAQLPVLIRGIYYEGWNPSTTPAHPRKKKDFLKRVDTVFDQKPLEDTETAVSAVFRLLGAHVSSGEIDDVKNAMPKQIRKLWP
ncbi:DUF2267 domain-containing protein [Hoeflea prorocentri]|uniref:DUF2267 domain-containing protein n=1 Tax=Hoeflea prorocentri TaxID=1922333 RepID=A0A9X3UF86_9HYPH|nr:DUF2267 domain-containing protein [Hoeflea prorocentri]MCY6379657.1 DUF2267 domain-containing protein [Hoeflea prorocentri]MDA5397457.1 DUF2267 domain-containing protein [Hoeflea prorocentri]